jgi:hypothetical protein
VELEEAAAATIEIVVAIMAKMAAEGMVMMAADL